MIGIETTTVPTATETATPPEMTRDRTMWLVPTTEPKIALSATFVPCVCMQELIVGNWIRTRAKDVIIGQVCSNEIRQG